MNDKDRHKELTRLLAAELAKDKSCRSIMIERN